MIAELWKLYTYAFMDPDRSPQRPQNKVQWDLRFYFTRQANENIDKFWKEHSYLCSMPTLVLNI